jgi:hypothetical protein
MDTMKFPSTKRDIPTISQLEELKIMACGNAAERLLRLRDSDRNIHCDYCECAIYCEDDSFCAIQKCIDFVKKVSV